MWLVTQSIRQQFERAQAPSAEQIQAFEARHSSESGAGDRILSIAGDTAQINIIGVLTQRPSWMAQYLGGGNTTYPDIIGAIALAESNVSVTKIVLNIDSGGGNVDGLFNAIAAIEGATKTTKAVVSGMAASAAYALAASADSIEAAGISARFGSIGVAVSMYVDDQVIDIASTDAPKKRPDVSTADGVAMVREELDALHEIFVDSIAAGRGVTAKKVNADFGRGGMLLANEALKRGMIDAVATKTAQSGAGNTEAKTMDLATLQAQHRAVYDAAVAVGVTKERDRVGAHLTAGTMSGDIETAINAAKDGTEMTQTLSIQYLMAAANRRDTQSRVSDDTSAAVGAAASGVATAGDGDDPEFLALLEASMGVTHV
ncbi:MAG: ATP-dependent Clp protease proteolytic subunit [Marinagarivorans sp.]|nr:ATP-dependent Clp protease proteolytic subunit [Marinagarivorans sp.]